MKHQTLVALALPLLIVGAAAAQELPEYDPLADIADHMHAAAGLLSRLTTGQPTQDTQKEVVRKLDVLIEELEKQAENSRGGSASANPSRPLADSTIKAGPGGSGDLHAPRKDGKQWGELPPHERDRILQSMTDGFPPHYQKILERYYRRLADEKPVGESAADESNDKPAGGGGAKTAPPAKAAGKPADKSAASGPGDQKKPAG